MNKFNKINIVIALSLLTSLSMANVEANDQLQYDENNHESIVSLTDPGLKWKAYRLDKGIKKEGVNKKPDGTSYMIAYGEAIVGKSLNDKGFMDSRNLAYSAALQSAKADLSRYLKVELNSNRAFIMEAFGGDSAPSIVEKIEKPLSIIDKANKLTGLALDNEIKKFDADWDGTNKTKDDIDAKIASQRELIIQNYASQSMAFLQGTTPIFNAEGPNDEGQYIVAVGIVWTPRSMLVAESIYNPTVVPPKGPKKTLSIQERLDNLTDEELAGSLGLRAWWDEDGLPVILSFGQATAKGSPAIAKNNSALLARIQIQQFVSEQIVAEDSLSALQDTRFYDDDNYQAFNESKFLSKIESMSRTLPLSGVGTVLYKKVYHPITNKKIVVNVASWSPESNDLARNLKQLSEEQETKMDATKGGAVFDGSQEDSNESSTGIIATTGLEGVSSDSDDF